MSKIICDVCGTSYPETATQCPICGCVRPGEVQTIVGDTNDQPIVNEPGNYTYVKGGRFSKSNVKKRNKAALNGKEEKPAADDQQTEKFKLDTGLTVAVVALLLAIIAVVVYIVLHFFVPGMTGKNDPADQTTASAQTTALEETTTEPTELELPCTNIVLDSSEILLEELDASWLLNARIEPADTTDAIVYESSDTAVATVNSEGLVTAVGNGTAEIRVICGDVEKVCQVVCTIPETTDPTEDTTEPTSEETEPSVTPDGDFELNREDFSLFFVGDSWDVYDGSVDASQILWSSDNEAVVTVKDGVVEAVGPGTTYIHAEYNATKVSCIVHCKFEAQPAQPGNDVPVVTPSEDGGSYKISHTEVMLLLNSAERRSFVLTLNDANGNPVNVTWMSSNACCSVSGNSISSVSKGTAKVYTTYEGREYSCIVYVQ